MRIEVLTVSDCPHRVAALTRLRQALDCTGMTATVAEQVIDDAVVAARMGMAGSPTILIDGRDPFADEASQPSISCRLYRSEAGFEGAPTLTALIDALTTGAAAS